MKKIPKKYFAYITFLAALGVFIFCMSLNRPEPGAKVTVTPTKAHATPVNHCEQNTKTKAVLVSVNSRHMWVCENKKQVYDAPVVTGIEKYPETLTPVGTYEIAGKKTNINLTGSDSAGSWDVFVKYWITFLTNQYGVYGFHDASWRKESDFGKVDPYSLNASHGCVELSDAAMKWLFDWAPDGTTLTVTT